MEIINDYISHQLDINKYFQNDNICFMDIETTGFSRKKNIIYLIGVLSFDSNKEAWHLRQFFANSMDKERDVLKEFINSISSYDKVITYNGDAFDIPFIDSRLNYHNIDYLFDRSKSFDLYQLIRANRQYLNLPDLKLKTVEKSLGFHREDIYSGGDCIGFYYDYIKRRNILLKDRILKHNYDDLAHMLDIISILDVIEDSKSIRLGGNNTFNIDSISIVGDMLDIHGYFANQLLFNIKHYDNSYSIVSSSSSHSKISIELKKGYVSESEQCYYVDLNEFDALDDLRDTSGYQIPSHFIVLTVEKSYLMDNIKNILAALLNKIIL